MLLLFLSIQAGAEGRADSFVPDLSPCAPVPLDRGGGFAKQDATGEGPPGEERPDLHPPTHAHRQGPQTAGGGQRHQGFLEITRETTHQFFLSFLDFYICAI